MDENISLAAALIAAGATVAEVSWTLAEEDEEGEEKGTEEDYAPEDYGPMEAPNEDRWLLSGGEGWF